MLRLAEPARSRLGLPLQFVLRDRLTIGRSDDANVKLDGGEYPLLISRLHATIHLPAEASARPSITNHGLNEVKLKRRFGEPGLAQNKKLRVDTSGELTEGCVIIFGSTGSLHEFEYILRRA